MKEPQKDTLRETHRARVLRAAATAFSFLCALRVFAFDGIPLWTNYYAGPGSSSDYAEAVAVDGHGNVFVTGGTVFLDMVTIAYSGGGLPLWTNYYNVPAHISAIGFAVAVDAGGNVFVAGAVSVSANNYDMVTIAYSGAGVPLWTNIYARPGGFSDFPNAIAVDPSGNVFVTGQSGGYSPTVAYSNAGVPLWTNLYVGPTGSGSFANGQAVDGSGNVFVTGFSQGIMSGYDYATVAYSGAGVPLWTNRYDAAHANDQANAVAVDGRGQVFVTGFSQSSAISGSEDFATIAYSSAGVPLWTNRYNGPGNGNDRASAVAVDGVGNVFVTGQATDSGGSLIYATIAYSGAGVPLWTNVYRESDQLTNSALAVAVDGSGNVYVTGNSFSAASDYDVVTIAYSGAGVPLWTNRYNGPGNGPDVMQSKLGLAIAPDGVVVVCPSDSTPGPTTSYDYAVVKYGNAVQPAGYNKLSAQLLTGGDVRLTLLGAAGTNYALDRTFNLSPSINWIPQQTNVAGPDGLLSMTNTPNPTTNNFWRMRSVP